METMDLTLTTDQLADFVAVARERVVLALPGLNANLAGPLLAVHERLPGRAVAILDTSEQVFRLGFGTLAALKSLSANQFPLLRKEGIRLGCVLIDGDAWFVSPNAQLVEPEPGEGSSILNACPISEDTAIRYFRALAASIELEMAIKGKLALEPAKILALAVKSDEIELVEKVLELAPPLKFDIHRQVLVYQSYVTFVELEFKGGNPTAKKGLIPKELLPLVADKTLNPHIQTTVDLFDEGIGEVLKEVNEKVDRIRAEFVRPLGDPYGAAILRRDVSKVERKVMELNQQVMDLQMNLAESMAREREKTIDKLAEACTDQLVRNPNEWILRRVDNLQDANSRKNVLFVVKARLSEKLPQGFAMAGKVKVTCVFKDFTFNSLKDEDVFKKLKHAFPDEDWDKPYRDAMAAMERKPNAEQEHPRLSEPNR